MLHSCEAGCETHVRADHVAEQCNDCVVCSNQFRCMIHDCALSRPGIRSHRQTCPGTFLREKIAFTKCEALRNCTDSAVHWELILLQQNTVHQGEQARQITPLHHTYAKDAQNITPGDCASVAEPASA